MKPLNRNMKITEVRIGPPEGSENELDIRLEMTWRVPGKMSPNICLAKELQAGVVEEPGEGDSTEEYARAQKFGEPA